MKNKKIIIIIIIALAIILVGVGLVFLLPNSNGKEKTKEVKEIRDYQTVEEHAPTGENTFTTTEPTKEDFGKDSKEVGFDKVECNETGCIATNDGYSNFEHKDSMDYGKDEKGDKTFNTSLYFHKNDFTVDNIHKQLNAVIRNYFSEEITKEQIKEVKQGLESSSDDYYQKTYISGQYTIELNMQNVVGTDFKLVKYQILNTELYNLYHNV